MDVTENYQFPYPQCSPPLVKDASYIDQVRDLAEAVDAEATLLEGEFMENLVRTDACRMTGAPIATTATEVQPFFGTATFDNTAGGAMTDTTSGDILVLRTGWYLIGGWWNITNLVADLQPRLFFTINGVVTGNSQGPSGTAIATEQYVSHESVFRLDAGDHLSSLLRHGGGTAASRTYTPVIHAALMVAA
jgi:hypothetical protein